MIPASGERTPVGGESSRIADHEQLLRLRVLEHPEAYVLAVSGSVDGLTAPRLRDAIGRGFAERAGRPVVVDMTRVDFFDSAGLRALSKAMRDEGTWKEPMHQSYRGHGLTVMSGCGDDLRVSTNAHGTTIVFSSRAIPNP